MDRFQVILLSKNSNGEAHSATSFEPLLRVSRFQTFLAKCNSQLPCTGSRKIPEVSCRILWLSGEREVANALPLFLLLESSFHWPLRLVDGVSPQGRQAESTSILFAATWSEWDMTLASWSAVLLFCHLRSLTSACLLVQKKKKKKCQKRLLVDFSSPILSHLSVSGRPS